VDHALPRVAEAPVHGGEDGVDLGFGFAP